MPTYRIKNKKSGKVKELFMSISEMETYEKEHPNEEVLCGAPLLHTGGGLGLRSTQTDESFREKLRTIDKKHPGNNFRDLDVKF